MVLTNLLSFEEKYEIMAVQIELREKVMIRYVLRSLATNQLINACEFGTARDAMWYRDEYLERGTAWVDQVEVK